MSRQSNALSIKFYSIDSPSNLIFNRSICPINGIPCYRRRLSNSNIVICANIETSTTDIEICSISISVCSRIKSPNTAISSCRCCWNCHIQNDISEHMHSGRSNSAASTKTSGYPNFPIHAIDRTANSPKVIIIVKTIDIWVIE